MYNAFSNRVISDDGDEAEISFDTWIAKKKYDQPQFFYWYTVLDMELQYLELLRCQRDCLFKRYLDVLESLIPMIFALDHTNYCKDLPVFLRDMRSLETRHPQTFKQLKKYFVAHKTHRPFSRLPLDQIQEQIIKTLKDEGTGVIGKTENPSLLRKHMVALPELARLLHENEFNDDERCTGNEQKHHTQYHKIQLKFQSDVNSLVEQFECLGNPFVEESGDLIAIGSSVVLSEQVIVDIRSAHEVGLAQYKAFVEERIFSQQKEYTATVSQCKLKLIDHQEDDEYNQQSSTSKEKPVSMQAILIASNSGRNISRVFDHENSSRPPSLCFARKSLPSKSNLSQIISESAACDYEDMESTPSDATVVIFDAAFVIRCLSQG